MGTVGFHRFDKDAVRAAIDGASAIFGVEAGQDAPRATPSRRSRRAGRAGRRRSMGLPSHIHAQRGSAARAHGSSASVAAAASTDDPQSRPTALLIPAPKPVTRRTTRAAGHRSRLRTHPSTINETSRQRDSNEKRIRFGGQTRSCIWASCTSWVLVDHKARRRPGRNQPSRRCVGNRTRPASPSSSHGTRQRRGPSVARRTSRRSPCRM